MEHFYKSADEAGIYYTIRLDENLNVADFNPFVREAYWEKVRRTIEVFPCLIHMSMLKLKLGKSRAKCGCILYTMFLIFVLQNEKGVTI